MTLNDLVRWLLNSRRPLRCTLGWHAWGAIGNRPPGFCVLCGKHRM